METTIPQEWTPIQPPQPIPIEPTPVPAQPILSTQPIIQVIMPDNKPADVDIQPEIIQTPELKEVIELTGENNILKDNNNTYIAIMILLWLIITAGIAYWVGTFRAPKNVEPDPIDIASPTYIPTTTTNNPVFFNNQPGMPPGNSNPEGSDTAPPGGVIVD